MMAISQETALSVSTPAEALDKGRRWALGFALIVMLVTTIPYLLGYFTQGADWRFTGFTFAVEDGNNYIAKMLSGSYGAWLFRTPYTAYPQNGVLAYLPYILLGKLAAPQGLHEQLVVLFHFFRIAAGCLALLATYDFLSFFIQEERLRRWGLALVAFGGGLGWLLLLIGKDTWLGSMPLDFYSPEVFGFLALFGIPHLAAARAALLWGLLVYLRSTLPGREFNWRASLVTGVCWLLAALFQPLTALVMGVILGAHLLALLLRNLWQRKNIKDVDWSAWRNAAGFVLVAFVIPAPYLVYLAVAFTRDPYFIAWSAQNVILSPPIPHYLLAYLVMLPFLPRGIRNLLRDKPWAGWLPIGWVAVFPLLAYAPVDVQRRLPEGVWVALVLIAVCSVKTERQAGVRWRTFQIASLLVFPTTIILLVLGVLAGMRSSLPLFRPAQEVAAFEQMAEVAPPASVVLASYPTGNAMPAWAPVRVLIGHGPESAGLEDLQPRVEHFFKESTTDEDRRALIDEFGVSYLFYGPAERSLGTWAPASAPFLERIYEDDPYVIFRVKE
jgi:hypothetical protein